MRRAEILLAIATAVLFGGCMRIYPDPELPDVEVSWFEDECRPGTGDMVIALVDVDASSRVEVTVPCSDLAYAFRDVARDRYRVEAALHDVDGNVFASTEADADLRDGLTERVSLYFSAFANFRVAWAFDMGASCDSLAATDVAIRVSESGQSFFEYRVPCFATPHFDYLPQGTFMVGLRALAGERTVATSPDSSEFTISDSATITDIGLLTLAPCGTSCP